VSVSFDVVDAKYCWSSLWQCACVKPSHR